MQLKTMNCEKYLQMHAQYFLKYLDLKFGMIVFVAWSSTINRTNLSLSLESVLKQG